ncbi:MAG: hypothetical protein BGO28_07095 [Alphaproteobacteria bacterium 43-37]|nr:MAG: hypothetical protein BGO28_07095 [Alphaproteobacteria bacterium 43-37]
MKPSLFFIEVFHNSRYITQKVFGFLVKLLAIWPTLSLRERDQRDSFCADIEFAKILAVYSS